MKIPLGTNISGSVAAIIMQVSRWSEIWPKWLGTMETNDPGFCKKNNYTLPVKDEIEPEQQFIFDLGHCFEPSIIEFAERETGEKLINQEKAFAMAIGSDKNAITCHIDAEYETSKRVHEGKTCNQNIFWSEYQTATDNRPSRVPTNNLIQCAHNEMVSGLNSGSLLSSLVLPFRQIDLFNQGWQVWSDTKEYWIQKDGGSLLNPYSWASVLYDIGNFHQYEIESNSDLQSVMLERYHHYWNHNVINGNPPKIEDWDTVLKYPIPDRFGFCTISEELLEMAREIPSHDEQIKESKKRIAHIKAQFANEAIKRNWAENKSKKERQKKIAGIRKCICENRKYISEPLEWLTLEEIAKSKGEAKEAIEDFKQEYRELVKGPHVDKIEIDKTTKDKIIFTNPQNGEKVASWSNTLRLSKKI